MTGKRVRPAEASHEQVAASLTSSVSVHYEDLLAPVYAWMMGGAEAAIARGREELAQAGLLDGRIRYAVDLGAGFGMHSIPLAQTGARILAIDSSALLLKELDAHASGAGIVLAQDDLRRFARHLHDRPDLVLCMGDTLAHLPDRSSVRKLVTTVAERLAPDGRFLVSFRDYSVTREGTDRFFSVRSDEQRLLTCFLEFGAETVRVHDMLHEFREGAWQMRVSAYRKLRLAPQWVEAQFEQCGLTVTTVVGPPGMVRFLGTRA
ncbi:MAG: methyltransferase domain-containing protein [Pseudomonadota bacterium]|nr:MAG: methyltransferase domain-containing protein [Pseudomonadota bacterium]